MLRRAPSTWRWSAPIGKSARCILVKPVENCWVSDAIVVLLLLLLHANDRAGMVCAKKFDNIMVTLRSEYNFPRDVAKHLVYNYGTRALQIAEIVRSGFGPDR